MKPATLARFDRLERLILNLTSTLNLHTEIIMSTLAELETKIADLTAGQAEAKADAARHEASTNQAVGLLQALSAKIAELAAVGPALITQAQLDALVAQADTGIADMTVANTQRDAADAVLDQGVAANTPAP